MRFKIDENLPVNCSNILIKKGFNAETVIQEDLQGSTDQTLVEICKLEHRILITLDLDISDIRSYPPGYNPGIIVLRLSEQSIDACEKAILRLASLFPLESPINKLWFVDETKIRIREK